jgi:hypothetical protein
MQLSDIEFPRHIAETLAALPSVQAVALGGSRATGTHGKDSDWDFAVYYRGPFDPAHLRALGWPGEVSEIGGWAAACSTAAPGYTSTGAASTCTTATSPTSNTTWPRPAPAGSASRTCCSTSLACPPTSSPRNWPATRYSPAHCPGPTIHRHCVNTPHQHGGAAPSSPSATHAPPTPPTATPSTAPEQQPAPATKARTPSWPPAGNG